MNIKRFFAIVLSICLLTAVLPLTALADPEVVASGDFSANGAAFAGVSWRITSDGVLTVSGSGPMPDYQTASPFRQYRDSFSSVVIENGISRIGKICFTNLQNLTGDLVIPDSVTSIGEYAFKNCTGLNGTLTLTFEDGTQKTLTQEVLCRDPHEGEFRCKRCDWYDEVQDTPGLRGIIYWMIHTITHFVQMINWLT